jgi:hypothetical protein
LGRQHGGRQVYYRHCQKAYYENVVDAGLC